MSHRYQFFLQIKQDILQGRLPVSFDLAAELGAYVVQCKISSFILKYILDMRFLLFLIRARTSFILRGKTDEALKLRGGDRIRKKSGEYENLHIYSESQVNASKQNAHRWSTRYSYLLGRFKVVQIEKGKAN